MSILCFYLGTFPTRCFRILTYLVMTWVALSGIAFISFQIFQCYPVAFIWEGWKKSEFGPHRCFDVNTLAYASAASSIAQDLVILIMPLPLIVKLNVTLRTKVAIVGMFSLGIFVLITSCVRLWAIYSFGDSANPTWDYTDAVIWTGLEVAVSIIVTSLPAIRVLANWPSRPRSRVRCNVPRSPGPLVDMATVDTSLGGTSVASGQVSSIGRKMRPRGMV